MIAVVTGSSRGIGRATAELLETKGYRVVRSSRSEGFDLRREDDVRRLFAGLERVDVLVNNAAVLTPRKPLVEVTTEEWDETMAVNVRAVFLCTREALARMIPHRRGWIVNISSGAGKRAAPMWGPYAVSKWAVEGLTKCLAAEVEALGVRVVAVNPGGTRTAMRAAAYPQEDPMTLKPPERVAEFIWEIISGQRRVRSGESVDYD